jgi:Flp pilus assembly protein TadD
VSAANRIRLQRILREAEGYLELSLPQRALDTLQRITEPGTFKGHRQYLVGEALRALERNEEAIPPLTEAVDLTPSNIQAWLALGWCYKRTGRLDQAVDALEHAHEVDPDDALIQYNLACYYSLQGAKRQALEFLSRAIAIDPDYRDKVGDERDFDPIRSDPDFRALVSVIV